MKLSAIVASALSVLCTADQIAPATTAHTGPLSNQPATVTITQKSFRSWLNQHGKQYESQEEHERRFAIYQRNGQLAAQHNRAFRAGYTSYSMSLDGPFADMTADEFRSSHIMEPQDCSATTHKSSGTIDSLKAVRGMIAEEWCKPTEVDWRNKGIITPIKNQAHCGSCWTFSTTGCLESHVCLEKRRSMQHAAAQQGGDASLTDHDFDCTQWTGLAEQQLVDCAQDYNNNGCDGGLPSQAFEYIYYNGGIDTEVAYPYQAEETGTCSYKRKGKGAKVVGVYNITSGDEKELVQAVKEIGPVSIAYQVSPDFRLYEHGIYDSFNATSNQTMCHNTPHDVNHAVVAVGLGTTDDGRDYYIVRNSWSKTWGMEGYFWMLRGENLCGVSDCASFPLVPTSVGHSTPTNGGNHDENVAGSHMHSHMHNHMYDHMYDEASVADGRSSSNSESYLRKGSSNKEVEAEKL
uniref:Peptidase C1A papain C-terminal domain-containing protein n=1 Tax=Craspedostauros australis TaxID=1486917 RepID=A0A7R9ZJB2_9STRA|mmetsp:Transcript_11458/g.31724  ORF Transcript_11458/g.31724 Transcript_11458/m.31724 type:complete len:463 (+) Transcript_11458:139-1527(+)